MEQTTKEDIKEYTELRNNVIEENKKKETRIVTDEDIKKYDKMITKYLRDSVV